MKTTLHHSLLYRAGLCLILVLIVSGCASKYRPINPTDLMYFNPSQQLDSSGLNITVQYNVLKISKNRKYARNERMQRISLVGILIENNGLDSFNFPEDFLIMDGGVELIPLEINEACEALMQYASGDDVVESENVGGFILFELLPLAINSAKRIKANKKFVSEMDDYYMAPSIIYPGTVVSGLLALPVKRETALFFQLRQ